MTRYTNKGVNDAPFISGNISTNSTYSVTGSAIYASNPSAYTDLSALGLAGISEIWVRFDIYMQSGQPSLFVKYEDLTGTGAAIGGNSVYIQGLVIASVVVGALYLIQFQNVSFISLHLCLKYL